MTIQCKSGVWLAEMNDFFFHFAETLDRVWARWGNIATITSGADGKHMEGSFHYKNQAWDLRVWGLKNPEFQSRELREALNEDGNEWRVLYGDEFHRDHIHVEVHQK